MRSSISGPPSFAKTKRLPITWHFLVKLRHLFARSPGWYFLLLLLTSSQMLKRAPTLFKIIPMLMQVL